MKTKTSKSKNIPNDGSQFRDKIELTKFEKFLPTPSEFIQKEREDDLRQYGIREPFVTWETDTDPVQNHLLWGHLDFRYALENNLPFTINKMKFSSEDDVKMYIIRTNGNRLHMSTFQLGVLYLQNKGVFLKEGKLRMSMGGKGIEVPDKWDTMKILSKMVGKGCSPETLHKIDVIRLKLKDDEKYRQLENGEISISKVYTELNEGTKGKDLFPFKITNTDEKGSTDQKVLDNIKESDTQSPYFINESDKYSVIYIHPGLNTKGSSTNDIVIDNLKKMNISDISYHKFSSLFIQIPSMCVSEMIDVIKEWGFTCKDTLLVSYKKSRYQSNYSEHYHDLLLVCHRNNVGVPPYLICNKSKKRTIPNEIVFDTIDSMFDDKLPKIGIFTGHRHGWDTFHYDFKNKLMIKFLKKVG